MSDHTNSPRPPSPGLTPPVATALRSALKTAPAAASAVVAAPRRTVTFDPALTPPARPGRATFAPLPLREPRPPGPRLLHPRHGTDCAPTATANMLRITGVDPEATQETVQGLVDHDHRRDTSAQMHAAFGRAIDERTLLHQDPTVARRAFESIKRGVPAVAVLSKPVDAEGKPVRNWFGHAELITKMERKESPSGDKYRATLRGHSYPMEPTGDVTTKHSSGTGHTQSARSILTYEPTSRLPSATPSEPSDFSGHVSAPAATAAAHGGGTPAAAPPPSRFTTALRGATAAATAAAHGGGAPARTAVAPATSRLATAVRATVSAAPTSASPAAPAHGGGAPTAAAPPAVSRVATTLRATVAHAPIPAAAAPTAPAHGGGAPTAAAPPARPAGKTIAPSLFSWSAPASQSKK